MGKKFTDLPLATALNDVDDFAIAQGGVSKRLPGSLLGGASGPFGSLAFEWNRVDVSQFDAAPSFREALSGSPGALSVVASAEHGNILRYTGGGGTGVNEVFLSLDPLVFPDERRDLVVEIETLTEVTGSSNNYAGAAFLCDEAGTFHGLMCCASANSGTQQGVIENDSVLAKGSTGFASMRRFTRYQVRGQKPAGAPPYASMYARGWGTTNYTEGALRTGSSSAARGSMADFGNNSTLGATWNALDCDRWGLSFMSTSGAPAITSVDFLSIRAFVG